MVGPVDGFVTAAGAQNPEAAQALLAYMSRPDVQVAWAIGQGNMSTNTTSDTSQVNNITQRAMEVAAAAETYNFNYDLATPPAPSVVGLAMFQEFINDSGDIAGLLERTQNECAAACEE